MICAGCRQPFDLTRRQRHPGLIAQRTRCGPCRLRRRRELGRLWDRQRRIRPESAPIYADHGSKPARKELSRV